MSAESNLRPPKAKRLTAFARNRKGTAAVEFAIVAMPFFYLMLATMETAMVYVAQTSLELSLTSVQRDIRTGAAQQANRSAGDMRQQVCDSLGQFLAADCATELWLDVDSFPSLASVTLTSPLNNGAIDPGSINYSPGGPDSIVLIRAYYAWQIDTPMLEVALGNMSGGKRLLTASRLMRVEPY